MRVITADDEAEIPQSYLERLVELEHLRWKMFQAGNDGSVCLVDVMGTDSSIVQAARVSYGEGTRHLSDDRQLIRYLVRNRHTTPFEMVELKFRVRCPMDVWRQWIRHRMASVNEYSTRYSLAIDSAQKTPPDEWREQSKANKQGSAGTVTEWPEGYKWSPLEASPEEAVDSRMARVMEMIPEESRFDGMLEIIDENGNFQYRGGTKGEYTPGMHLSKREEELHRLAREVYEERVNKFDVAREQARKDLPLSTYTEAYWKIDLHNLLHFLGLRMDSHAQKEIRDFATIIGEEIVAKLFPITWEAFVDYRMKAMTLTRLDIETINKIRKRDIAPYEPDFTHGTLSELLPEDWTPKFNAEGVLKVCRERDEFFAKAFKLGLVRPTAGGILR